MTTIDPNSPAYKAAMKKYGNVGGVEEQRQAFMRGLWRG